MEAASSEAVGRLTIACQHRDVRARAVMQRDISESRLSALWLGEIHALSRRCGCGDVPLVWVFGRHPIRYLMSGAGEGGRASIAGSGLTWCAA